MLQHTRISTPAWRDVLQRAPLDGRRFGEVVDEQFRVRYVHTDDGMKARPDSLLAAELWDDASTKKFVDGIATLARRMDGSGRGIGGVSLATDETGAIANRALHEFGASRTADREMFGRGIADARRHLEGTNAVRKGAWLHLGPVRSSGMLDNLQRPGEHLSDDGCSRLGSGVKTLLHELHHVAPERPAQLDHLDWLAEGRAEALSRWPGRVPAAGRTLGMPVPLGVGRAADTFGPYQDEVLAVRELVRLAGVDPGKSANYPKAAKLLDWRAEGGIDATLGAAIAKRHGDTASERRSIERDVREAINEELAPNGSDVDPAALKSFVRSIERR